MKNVKKRRFSYQVQNVGWNFYIGHKNMCGDHLIINLKNVILFWEVMFTFAMNLNLAFEPSQHFTFRKGDKSYEKCLKEKIDLVTKLKLQVGISILAIKHVW